MSNVTMIREADELIGRHGMHIRRAEEHTAQAAREPHRWLLHSNRAFHHTMRQCDIEDQLIKLAERGCRVARVYLEDYYRLSA